MDVVIFLSGVAFGLLVLFIVEALFDPRGGGGLR